MSEIKMGKLKHAEESEFVAVGTLDVVFNPHLKRNEKIKSIHLTDIETFCPQCKKKNPAGIEIIMTESDIAIYICPQCDNFVWLDAKKKTD